MRLLDGAGFRSEAGISEVEFAAANIAQLLPQPVGVLNGMPLWREEQATSFLSAVEKTILERHSVILLSGSFATNGATPKKANGFHADIVTNPSKDDRLPEDMASDVLGLSSEVLKIMRKEGNGPAWAKDAHGKVVYRLADLEAFQAEARRVNTKREDTRPLMDEKQAAQYMGYTASTLKGYRNASKPTNGKGPAFQKIGRKVMFKPADLDAWLAAHKAEIERTRRKPRKAKTKRALVRAKASGDALKKAQARMAHARAVRAAKQNASQVASQLLNAAQSASDEDSERFRLMHRGSASIGRKLLVKAAQVNGHTHH